MKKMKAKGYSRGGAPTTRAQRRSTLSKAQKNLLDSVQGREGSKQSTSVIQDLSDQYGYKPGKRAGAKGGMGKGKRAKPPGMQMGGAMKAKGMQRGGMMKAKGMKKGGKVAGTSRPSATSGFRAPSSKSSGLYGK
jgi:hypothetical protein